MNYKIEGLIFISILSLCFLIVLFLFFFIYFLIFSKKEREKTSAYECGFHPYQDRRKTFGVSFYMIAIVFLVFDLEYIYIFALIYIFREINNIIYYFIGFVIIFIICFLYE